MRSKSGLKFTYILILRKSAHQAAIWKVLYNYHLLISLIRGLKIAQALIFCYHLVLYSLHCMLLLTFVFKVI